MSTCFYAVNNPENPLSQLYSTTRSMEYEAWLKLIPDFEEDSELVSEKYARQAGESPNNVIKILVALQRLTTELPQLHKAITTHWHLDFPRIIAIDTALSKLGATPEPEVISELDAKITSYLTPRTANQHLPSPRNIGQRVRQMVAEFDDRIPVKDPRPQRRFSKTQVSANASSLTIEAPHEEIETAHESVKATARELGISRAEAILKILSGELDAKQVQTKLVLFTAKDLEGVPAYLQGVGWVGPETVDRLREDATIIDMDAAATAETASYRPTDAIRTFVEGRDGTCRWPGCSVPAQHCQLDHRHNFDEGGPTSPSNLFALCQHHHNVKTDTRAHYIVDPISDVIYWIFEDGTWVSDSAQDGPIGRGAKNWLQSFAQKIVARRKNAQERAHEQAQEIDDWYHERAAADKREQEFQDLLDETWVDDVKLAQAWLREGDFTKPFPPSISPNVFMLIEAANIMGLNFTPPNDIAGWVRVHKKLVAAEKEEIERRVQEQVDRLANLVPENLLEEFKYKVKAACRLPHNWKRPWRKKKENATAEEPPF